MERSKIILWVVVAVAAAVIVWRVGFHIPGPVFEQPSGQGARAAESGSGGQLGLAAEPNGASKKKESGESGKDNARADAASPEKPADASATKKVAEPNKPGEAGRPGEPNRPGGMREGRMRRFSERGAGPGGEPNGPGGMPGRIMGPPEPNGIPGPAGERMEAINLKDVEMKDIIQKLAEWTGKVVIPTDEAMKQKVTIYAPEKLPRNQALSHIYSALRMKGFVAEHEEKVIYLRQIKEAKLGFVPTIGADQALAMLENKDQIVQKFFKLKSFKPTQMGEVIQPLVGEHGYVSADENTASLLVIDTVSNLMRIEKIINEFDVPEAEQAVTKVFEIKHGDPAEIVQLLRLLLGVTEVRGAGGRTVQRSDRFGGSGGMGGMPQRPPEGGQPQQKGESKPGGGAATSVVVGRTQGPIVLIPEPRRKWIIARASAGDIEQIGEWLKKLDMAEPVESEYEVIPLVYANADEVEQSVESALRDMPGMELMPSVLIEPIEGQVIVFGRKDLRELVKKLVAEIDIPPGQLETKPFKLKYADPDQVKTSLDELYGEGSQSSDRYMPYYMRFDRRRTTRTSDIVKVISYPSLKQVTVIASPENIKKIGKQIEEWDKPLDVKEVKPRIIELRNSDPVKMAELLTKLFTEDKESSSNFFRIFFFDDYSEQKKKIIGPLYGQLAFEDVPGTKKIIVISKIPEAYDVIDELVRELDRQEMGEVPKVITLKYADPEDLSERLNAIFNEAGTVAPIRRSAQGLSSSSTTQTQSSSSSQSSSSQSSGQGGTSSTSSTEYRPPWTAGRRTTDEAPISNVIGRVRFIPDPHSKSILVLAPPEFMENIEKIIHELDIPGKQVMVKAVIIEVDHRDVSSLGLQLATTDPSAGTVPTRIPTAFSPTENTATAWTMLREMERSGSLTVSAGMDVTTLIDLLVKKVHAKILNQQTLWTKDNGEASFFKGDNVALQTASTSAGISGQITSSYEFNRVGMTLRVRPRITPEKNVDMVLNIILSQVTSEQVNFQPKRTEMETTTNMIVQNGQTVMLGGILFQKDSKVQRKIPLLGDIPLAGELFRHNEVEQRNNELIMFVTPYVIDEGQQISPEANKEMAKPMERLKEVQEQLKATAEQLEQPSE